MPVALSSDCEARRMALYRRGLNDTEMAPLVGVSVNAICQWRRKRGLKANLESGKYLRALPDTYGPKYRLGWSDARIAAHYKRSVTAVRSWRVRRSLQANFATGAHEGWMRSIGYVRSAYRDPIYRLVADIVPRWSEDMRDDAISEAVLDLLERGGDPVRERIMVAARRGLAAALGARRTRSLDAPISHGDNRPLIAALADASWSNWLEEMGATAF